MKIQSLRAHPDSTYGQQWRSRAIAVDKHGCLVFIIRKRLLGCAMGEPLEVEDTEGDNFEDLFGRFLE